MDDKVKREREWVANLRQQLREVGYARRVVLMKASECDAAQERLQETPEHRALVQAELRLMDAKEALSRIDEAMREAAVAAFVETGHKAFCDGALGIRERKSVVMNKQTALLWALEHKLFLRLDADALTKHVLENGVPVGSDFVQAVVTTPTATVRTDLEGWLQAEETDEDEREGA